MFRYAVLGAGRQGVAAAYDLAKFGEANEVLLIDINSTATEDGASLINKLLNKHIVTPIQLDIRKTEQLIPLLDGVTSFISAVHYTFNIALVEVAISIGANMCDLGGNTEVVRQELLYDSRAKKAGVTIVPDCGMGPGMNISLALYAMSLVDKPLEVYIWDGGLPQKSKPPWNYSLTFNIAGLTNEYYGNAYFLRNGKVTEVPCFEGYEKVKFPPPIGELEAFVTSGGLSTLPWTFEGKLKRLENKTLRYPGHWAEFKAFARLGLLELKPIQVGDVKVVPREVLHALLEPQITEPQIRDIGIIRTKCIGEKDGKPAEALVELIDYYDEKTGFTAMQRLTGWHASIIAILSAQKQINCGVIPVELAVSGGTVVREARKRGFNIKEEVYINPASTSPNLI